MSAPDLSPQIMAKLHRTFASYPELTEVILFGSRAIGNATPRSDIDLATRGIKDEHRLGRLALDLEDLDIPQTCDLRACEDMTYAPLRRHLETHGVVIYRRT